MSTVEAEPSWMTIGAYVSYDYEGDIPGYFTPRVIEGSDFLRCFLERWEIRDIWIDSTRRYVALFLEEYVEFRWSSYVYVGEKEGAYRETVSGEAAFEWIPTDVAEGDKIRIGTNLFTVVGSERVETPQGSQDCWVCQYSYNASNGVRLWHDKDTGVLLKLRQETNTKYAEERIRDTNIDLRGTEKYIPYIVAIGITTSLIILIITLRKTNLFKKAHKPLPYTKWPS